MMTLIATPPSAAAALPSTDIDLPAQPQALARVTALLQHPTLDLAELSAIVENDMTLAAALLLAVNSAHYGINGRVHTVRQALGYLGTCEVAALVLEIGLRAAFPPAPELDALWQRAALRGQLMSRLGQALGVDPWVAHAAGLFEECGKAVLFRHAGKAYGSLLQQTHGDDEQLLRLEHRAYGASHDLLGAALCESWGLAAAAVHAVRHHVIVIGTRALPPRSLPAPVCVLSALAHGLMHEPAAMEELAHALARPAGLEVSAVLRAARRLQDELAGSERRRA